MSDYSKPISFYCSECRRMLDTRGWDEPFRHFVTGPHGVICNGSVPTIPVYAVIPEGERPEAKEPGKNVVTRASVAERTLLGVGAWSDDTQPDERWAGCGCGFGCCNVFTAWVDDHRQRRGLSLADAVLWVAEGRLP